MEKKEDKIIEEIKESLISYELPYEEGAWERFYKKQQTTELTPVKDLKNPSFKGVRKVMAVAASLIFLISIISMFRAYYSDKQSEIAKIERADSVNEENRKRAETLPTIVQKEEDKERKVYYEIIDRDMQIVGENIDSGLRMEDIEEGMNAAVPEVKEAALQEDKTAAEIDGKQADSEKELKSINTFEKPMFLSLNAGEEDSNFDNDENWKFGVELSSSFISDKMNYGGGVFAERKLSDKVSLSSGVVFTKINAANDMKPVGISSSTRKIGVESSMQALDIPLSIVYQVSDGFYASMGVSLLTVLNEDKSYQYETDIVSESFVKDPETGIELAVYSTVTRQYTEPVKESDQKGNNNIGYFNLSIGKEQGFYGKTKLLLEPFLKVPVGKLSDKEVKLMNAGLKIKVMF